MAVFSEGFSIYSLSLFLIQLFTLSSTATLILLYIYLKLTTSRDPDLSRDKSEETYTDPSDGNSQKSFPSISDRPTVYLSLVVPAYKEEKRLPKMMEVTIAYLENRRKSDSSFTYEIIIVNDGSPDDTDKVALKYVTKYGVDKVRLLNFVRNRGKGGAVRMGCLSARGERILFLDADGATEISSIQVLENNLNKITKDYTVPAVTIGSRAHLEKEAVANRTFLRNFLMYGFHFLVYFLCVKGIKDTQCGFKMCTRAAVEKIFSNLHIERWAFDVEMLYIAQYLNIPIKEVAVNWEEIEGSKMVPIFSWMQMGRDLLFIRLRYMFGLWTIKTKSS